MVSAHPLCSPWASFQVLQLNVWHICSDNDWFANIKFTFSCLPLHQAEMMNVFLTAIGAVWALCKFTSIFKSAFEEPSSTH